MGDKIKRLNDLFVDSLLSNEKIVKSDISQLTAPGENFGSVMLSLIVTIENVTTGKKRTLNTVAKLVPDSEYAQKMFNTPVTFRNEVKFYTTVIPTLDSFLKEKGIVEGVDFAAKTFGCRLALDAFSETVDQDAVLVLENIKPLGYKTGNKLEGLDLNSSKAVLEILAKLHAAGLGLKLQNPKSFHQNVKPYLTDHKEDVDYLDIVANELKKVLTQGDFSQKLIDHCVGLIGKNMNTNTREPWSTIIHYDCWVNNIMIKYDNDRPIDAILVDFQLCGYKPPTRDILLFIFSSVQDNILDPNMIDFLLTFYHQNLIERLEKLKVDTRPFSKDAFDEEVKMAARENEYFQIILMLPPILERDFAEIAFSGSYNKDNPKSVWNEKHRRRIMFVTKEFARRGWLL